MPRKSTIPGSLALPFTDTFAAPTGQTFVGIDGARATVEAPTLLDALGDEPDHAPAPFVPAAYLAAIWSGQENGRDAAQARMELSDYETTLAGLNAGTVRPSTVIGTGYKRPKTLAREWLSKQIEWRKATLATDGLIDPVNLGNVTYNAPDGHPIKGHRMRFEQSTDRAFHLFKPVCSCGYTEAGYTLAFIVARDALAHLTEHGAWEAQA